MSMLRRHSTKSRKDLERRKSTSSVRSVQLEHLNAATAQRDAHIAATQAFARNQQRHTAEMPLFQLNMPSPRFTNDSTTASSSFRTSRIHASTDPADNREDGDLQRRHSVRFVGPAPDKRRLSCRESSEATGRESHDSSRTKFDESHRKNTETTAVPRVLQNTHNTQNQMPSSDQAGPATSKLASRFIQALAAEEEYYTPEDDIASMPSSYRRLRRSKSMFPQEISKSGTAIEGSQQFLSNVSVRPRLQPSLTNPGLFSSATTKENVYPATGRMVHSLRAPKSMSFLRRRGRSEPIDSRHFEAYTPWAGLQIGGQAATDQSSLRQHGTLFSWSKNKKSETGIAGLRKSLRTSSTSSSVPPILAPAVLTLPGDGTLRDKARKASRSIKSKIKTLFRSARSETGSTGIPEQHIEAQHTHVTTEIVTPRAAQEVSSPGVAQPTIPSLPAAASDHTLRSHPASMESLRADTDDKSRVTSWTSSNQTTDTVFHEAESEWERQRLSVINEGGAHCPSRSACHSEVETESSMFRKGSFHPERPAPMPPGAAIDSQRIYSALMKRMNENVQPQEDTIPNRPPSASLSDPFRTASPGSSSIRSRMALVGATETSPMTIRCVASSTKKLSELGQDPWAVEDISPKPQEDWAGDVGTASPRREMSRDSQQLGPRSFLSSPSPEEPEFVTAVGATVLSPFADPPTLGASPVLAHRVADAGTGFFASPTTHLFRTTSPYRRALRASMRAAGSTDNSLANYGPLDGDADKHDLDGHSERQGSVYSESVYSYQTGDDQTHTKPNGVTEFLASPFDEHSHRPRPASSVSSEDWKSWLAANVTKLEPQYTPGQFDQPLDDTSPTHRESRVFGLGHVRERTQICSDDDPDPFHSPAAELSLPATPAKAVGHTKWPTLTAPQSLPHHHTAAELPRDKSPLRPQSLVKGPPGPPPPIPPKSARRAAQSSSATKILITGQAAVTTTTTDLPKTPNPRVVARRTQSLARMRSINRLRATATGSPFAPLSTSATLANVRNLTSGSGASGVPPGTSSPGLSAAVERQFGGTVTATARQYGDDKENSPRTEVMGSGSKVMVDNFLKSRRKGVGGEVEEEEGEGSCGAGAFI